VDPVTAERLPRNKTGEVRIRGPSVTMGYLNNPDATKRSFDSQGFFITGKLGSCPTRCGVTLSSLITLYLGSGG